MNSLEKIFAKNIKTLRSKKGLSQAEVAEGIGVTLVAYQNYEREQRRPKKEIIPRIANFFGVDIEELYKENSELKTPKTFAESIKVGRLIELLGKKTSSIPQDVFEMAYSLNEPEHEVWDEIRGLLEHAIQESSDSKKIAKA